MNTPVFNLKTRAQSRLVRWPQVARRCDSPDCAGNVNSWHKLIPHSATILLRGMRLCFPRCFERELRRIVGPVPAHSSRSRPEPRRLPLGLIMLSRGAINHGQLQQALNAQTSAASGRIGFWLQTMGFVDEAEIASALASQWSCPLLKQLPGCGVQCTVPASLLRAFRLVPIYFTQRNRILHLAVAGDIPYQLLLAIEEVAECKTQACVTTETELERGLDRLLENVRSEEKLFENCREPEEVVRVISSYSARVSATEVRLAQVNELFWARVVTAAKAVDLLFCSGRLGQGKNPSMEPRTEKET